MIGDTEAKRNLVAFGNGRNIAEALMASGNEEA